MCPAGCLLALRLNAGILTSMSDVMQILEQIEWGDPAAAERLLDAEAITANDLAELYRARWSAELHLRSLRKTQMP